MRLLSCIVSHDRGALLRRTVESYLATVSVPFVLVIVDSASTEHETIEYLRQLQNEGRYIIWIPENVYPGAACNEGWAFADSMVKWTSADETFMHRSDNDVEYLPGWCEEVEHCFTDPEVGQVGLMLDKFEVGATNVGGNCLIRKSLWNEGLRWDETTWKPLIQEDGKMSGEIIRLGLRLVRVQRECIIHHGWDYEDYPDYYDRSATERGIGIPQLHAIFENMKKR